MTQSNDLSRSITKFLRSAGAPKSRHCHRCGALMEHIHAICYFDGKKWEIALPVCTECEPDSGALLQHFRVA
jgi:hypothetical protein